MRILIYLAIAGIGAILLHEYFFWGLSWALLIAYIGSGGLADVLARRGLLPKVARGWWK